MDDSEREAWRTAKFDAWLDAFDNVRCRHKGCTMFRLWKSADGKQKEVRDTEAWRLYPDGVWRLPRRQQGQERRGIAPRLREPHQFGPDSRPDELISSRPLASVTERQHYVRRIPLPAVVACRSCDAKHRLDPRALRGFDSDSAHR